MVSATRRSQGLARSTAAEQCAEAFQAADDLLRALKRFQALRTDRPDEMRDWLAETASTALDQLGNVEGAIDRDLDRAGCAPAEPLDLNELVEFWRSMSKTSDADTEESGW
jgi:MoxR-like ATPase